MRLSQSNIVKLIAFIYLGLGLPFALMDMSTAYYFNQRRVDGQLHVIIPAQVWDAFTFAWMAIHASVCFL